MQNNVEATVRMLEGVARWRHDFGVDRFTDAYFAAEFYTSGAAFRYEADKRGFLPVYLRIARNPRISGHFFLFFSLLFSFFVIAV